MIKNFDYECGWLHKEETTWQDLTDKNLQWGSFKLFGIKADGADFTSDSKHLETPGIPLVYENKSDVNIGSSKLELNKVIYEANSYVDFSGVSSDGMSLKRMKNYLPWFEQDNKIFNLILEIYDAELRKLSLGRSTINKNLFTSMMSEEVLETLENQFGIVVHPSYSLQQRRELVRARWIYQFGQLTERKLKDIISSFTNSECDLIMDYDSATVTVDFIGTVGRPLNLKGISDLLNQILPAVWTWKFRINYNSWDMLLTDDGKYQYSWSNFSGYTWDELRQDESIRNGTVEIPETPELGEPNMELIE